jgi:hypothetical protein
MWKVIGKKQIRYQLPLLLLALFIIMRIALMRHPSHPKTYTKELSSSILVGMPRREVEAMLGGPAGDYTTRPYLLPAPGSWFGSREQWISDDGAIGITFDKDDRVTAIEFTPVLTQEKPTLFRDLLTRIGLRRQGVVEEEK